MLFLEEKIAYKIIYCMSILLSCKEFLLKNNLQKPKMLYNTYYTFNSIIFYF